MLKWNTLLPGEQYVVDLVQECSGLRYARIRRVAEAVHPMSVLQSATYSGEKLKEFGNGCRISEDITTSDGRCFGIDCHGIWMTIDEAKYWKENRSQAALLNPLAPWVNNKPPIFPPS